MASLTVVAPPVFICLVSIASLALAFAASEDLSSDAGDCQVAPAAAATGASLLQSRKHVSLERPLAVGAGHGGVQKGLPIVNSLVKLVESSDAAGRTGPEAIPSVALPNPALLQASSSGTVMQNFQAPHRQRPESISLADQSSGSAQSALSAAQLTGLVWTLARAVMPISLMLVISSAILAMLHRIMATERTEDVAQQNAQRTITRTLQFIEPVEQGEGTKSAALSTSLVEHSSITSLTTAEPASPENPPRLASPDKAAKSADEAAGSPAASSAHVIARVLESMEEGEAPCEGLGQTVPHTVIVIED